MSGDLSPRLWLFTASAFWHLLAVALFGSRRVSLKPFDIGIDRALKALGLHVCMAPSFGAEFGPLPEDCRDIRRGSKHLLHKRGAPQIDECKPVFAISRWKLMGIATLYIWAIPTAECQSSRTRQYSVSCRAAHRALRRLSRRQWFLQPSVNGSGSCRSG